MKTSYIVKSNKKGLANLRDLQRDHLSKNRWSIAK